MNGRRLGRGGWLIVVVLVGALLGHFGLLAFSYGTSVAGMDYEEAARLIESAESDGVLSGKQCGPNTTAKFNRRAWLHLTERQQLGAMLTISRVCSERGQSVPVRLLDAQTGDTLDVFDGRKIIR